MNESKGGPAPEQDFERREFLTRAGKMTLGAAPAVAVLLAASAKPAFAQSYSGPTFLRYENENPVVQRARERTWIAEVRNRYDPPWVLRARQREFLRRERERWAAIRRGETG